MKNLYYFTKKRISRKLADVTSVNFDHYLSYFWLDESAISKINPRDCKNDYRSSDGQNDSRSDFS